jgi:hypothetical protein
MQGKALGYGFLQEYGFKLNFALCICFGKGHSLGLYLPLNVLILLVVEISPTFLFVLYIGPSMNLSPN